MTKERAPIRLRIRPVLYGGLGQLFAGITAFELGNCAATLMIVRATDLLRDNHSRDRATTIARSTCGTPDRRTRVGPPVRVDPDVDVFPGAPVACVLLTHDRIGVAQQTGVGLSQVAVA